MGNITTIIDSGFDSFTNLFDVKITLPTLVQESMFENISIRVQGFTPPDGKAEPYTTHYKLNEIDRNKPLLTLERKLPLTIRLDSDYKILQALKKWKNIFFSGDAEGAWKPDMYNGSGVIGNVAEYGTIEAKAYSSDLTDGNFTSKKVWKYSNVVCSKIGTPTFTRESSNPVTVNVEFLFLTFEITT